MSDEKPTPTPEPKPEPRRVQLSSGESWQLHEVRSRADYAVAASERATAHVDQIIASILKRAGLPDDDGARWTIELGDEVALVEHLADD